MVERLRAIPGIHVVASEIWKIASPVGGRSILARSAMSLLSRQREQSSFGIFDALIIEGMDIASHLRLQRRALIAAMISANRGGGRFLGHGDEGQNRIVISARTAADFPDPQGHSRRVGDTLKIGEQSFEIVGIFSTGSLVLDRSDMAVNITRVMNDLDMFLLMVISLAVVVGCVGIINTMLMSTLERCVEFGILRTNGWKRRNVL